mmetsp:Transcript_41/g.90  ORF Transcript_41/g.90 Transcript_41/m.90 type:complete len:725 (-) Transcript_41:175-2349(-)
MDDTDYNRPRRPNADTLTYMKSLPFDEVRAQTEINAYLEHQKKDLETVHQDDQPNEVEYPQMLSAAMSALDEIQNEIASLAGDELGSKCIETIARIAAPYSTTATRKLLHGITGYMIHLSTHRYGSHVVQTILQNVLKNWGTEVAKTLEIDEEEEEDLPSLRDLIFTVAKEVAPVSKDLALHICGSHVLRSLLCILSGCTEVVPDHLANKAGPQRGKLKSKKKKKKKKFIEDGSSVTNNASYSEYKLVENPRLDPMDQTTKDCFNNLVFEMTELDLSCSEPEKPSDPGELQQFACNPSAGPLLIVLLRILTLQGSEISKDETQKNVKPENLTNEVNDSISNFRLGILPSQIQFAPASSAEKLAKTILCWNEDGNEQAHAGDVIYGLSGETRGSHLLEMMFRISNDSFYEMVCSAGKFFDVAIFCEYANHDVSNFVMQTLLNTARTREHVELLIKCVEEIIVSGFVLDPKNKRRGILWRAVEMASKFRIGQETLLKCMKKGFKALNMDGTVSMLLDLKQPEKEGGRLILDATGARTVYQLLHFVPRLCNDVLSGILEYSADELENMCNDGLASRCIIDGILDGPTKQKPFSQAVKKLFSKLEGRWVSLSVSRVGHHTVRKIFIKLQSMDDKAALSAELAQGINRLNGNSMGRSIITDCAVKDYLESKEVWESAVKKRMEKESFLKDIFEGNLDGGEKKRKRKRKKVKEGTIETDQDEVKKLKENE